MNIVGSKNKSKVLFILQIIFIIIFFLFLYSFLYIHFNTPHRIIKPIISHVDDNILEYRGCREIFEGAYECSLEVVSDNAEGVGDEIKKIYDNANHMLKSIEDNIGIEIIVIIPRVEYGSCKIVALLNNFGNSNSPGFTDHISCVEGHGITRECEIYDSEYDYEINHGVYWEYFSGAEKLNIDPEKMNIKNREQ